MLSSFIHKAYPFSGIELSTIIGHFQPVHIDCHGYINTFDNLTLGSLYQKLRNNSFSSSTTNFFLSTLEKNLQLLMENRVAPLIMESLSKFSAAEIRDMVENFMGKELKPITLLGALLGGIAGIGTLFLSRWFPIVSYTTPVVYGITGVLTNHIAILMLFRPYKKVKYLPYFSPGVIEKRKYKFADNMGRFISDDVLNVSSVRNVLLSKQDILKTFVKQRIVESNNVLDKDTYHELSKKISKLTINYIDTHRDKISNFVVKKIREKEKEMDFSELIPLIKKLIYNQIFNSNFRIPIESMDLQKIRISDFSKISLTASSKLAYLLYDKIIDFLEWEKIKKFILNYKEEYDTFISEKKLKDFLSSTTQKELSIFLYRKFLDSIRSSGFEDYILQLIESKALNPNQKLRNAFNGALFNLLQENMGYFFDIIYEKLPEIQDFIEREVKKEVRKHLGLMSLFMNDEANSIASNFIVNIEIFLREVQEDFEKLVLRTFSRYTLSDLGIDESVLDREKINAILKKIFDSKYFKKTLKETIKAILETILSMDVKTFMKILNIRSLKQFLEVIDDIAELFISNIEEVFNSSEEKVKEILRQLISDIILELSHNIYLGDISKDIDIDKDLQRILHTFLKEYQEDIELFIEEILSALVQKEFYDSSILKEDISKFIHRTINAHKHEIENTLLKYIELSIPKIWNNISTETKEEIVSFLVDALINALESNLEAILQAIDIKTIVKEEIIRMPPQEVEKMFTSFAGDYFRKIKLYGGFGSIFGIPSLFV